MAQIPAAARGGLAGFDNSIICPLRAAFRHPVSVASVNALLAAAARGPLARLIAYSEEAHASIDFNHDAHSSTIDSLETAVIDGKLVRVLSWYDNEWGFSNRMIDTAGVIAKFL